METQTRPRSKSNFSFRSSKSDKSNGGNAKPKLDLTETEADKKKSRFSGKSKINPNRALDEAQPTVQAQEASTILPLNNIQHRDLYGNVITDPDRTNPTRFRFERPLDTIRSFEAAIDTGYKRRSQAIRAESAEVVPSFQSRRTSVPVGNDMPFHNPRYSPASAYGSSRNASMRGSYDVYSSSQFPQRRSIPHRVLTSPMPNRLSVDYSVYNSPAYHTSHDTVNTIGESSGSNSTEPWGNSTDPSSENSSIDRVHAMKHPDSADAYGGNYGRGSPMHEPIQEENGIDGRYQPRHVYNRPPMHSQGPMRHNQNLNNNNASNPSAYRQQTSPPRPVIRLGGDTTTATTLTNYAQSGYAAPPGTSKAAPSVPHARQAMESEPKKGWLKRKFSKNQSKSDI